jgi:MoaA/NifB/PqqE/SkfB family radical SAM enzyme
VCSTIDNRSEFWINTTGDGVTRERLSDLKTLGVTAIKISMHGTCKEEHNAFMGHDTAWDKMNDVINLCKEMSIAFTLNTRILPDDFSNGFFEKMMTIGAESGASYIQFLTPRTAGGNFSGKSITYSLKQLEDLKILFRKYNTQSRYADYPAIFFDELDERCIFGCTAGSGRIYMNVKGEIQPCQHLNVSFGNVRTTPYEQIIDRMGKVFNKHDFTTTCTILPGLIAKDIGDTPEFPVFMTNVIEEHIKSIFPKKN